MTSPEATNGASMSDRVDLPGGTNEIAARTAALGANVKIGSVIVAAGAVSTWFGLSKLSGSLTRITTGKAACPIWPEVTKAYTPEVLT
ncbi:MAG TPA: hypothetical protein DDZ51_26770 [Planctomycetaceae bacterium]|nr:hypothetical protein [Planctomycetaceae bacterium]